ncbi:S41 family peptidase [Shewanella sp. D64]|uniref:S41 family peptidase n=1 Tax=unclassified Shewanella TaxID=196818 RepID=UPI0022BA46B2|nr:MULTISPECIES: S41 family peptidase [unclassified Shewanella]MEC4726341.1 S41 family peptidase [Shewanella sp. D64]MEC4738353.1 S41 family peptidase [Shewanella sp. E94]WBJ95487.1 S41 family peptidase [Shewanella sp. MTB7]
MSQLIRYLSFTLLGLALGLSVTLSSQENAPPFNSRLNYPLLLDIIDTVETYYVTEFTQDELIAAAIEGIFAKLDPYSNFLDQQAFFDIRDANKGEYFGFGVEIATQDDKITIITPFADSPADHAGIKPGDQILKLNNKAVDPRKLDQLLKEIKHHSQNNLSIVLTLSHANMNSEFKVTLIPSVISIQSVSAKILDDEIGYIKLSSFQDDSTKEIIKQLTQWKQKKLTGIILDLRNNPGGLLDQAIKIADIFLAKGRIVSTEGRFFDANSEYYASPQTMLSHVPMTILINRGSASASEVLAAALQENNRAKIIGETSFGKGTVQSLIPTLIEGNAIKLTIARYTTPNGRDINSKGIEPDIKLDLDTVTNDKSMLIIDELAIQGKSAQDKILNSAITWIKTKQ